MKRHSGMGWRRAQPYLAREEIEIHHRAQRTEVQELWSQARRAVNAGERRSFLEILIDFDRFPGMIPLPYASHHFRLG